MSGRGDSRTVRPHRRPRTHRGRGGDGHRCLALCSSTKTRTLRFRGRGPSSGPPDRWKDVTAGGGGGTLPDAARTTAPEPSDRACGEGPDARTTAPEPSGRTYGEGPPPEKVPDVPTHPRTLPGHRPRGVRRRQGRVTKFVFKRVSVAVSEGSLVLHPTSGASGRGGPWRSYRWRAEGLRKDPKRDFRGVGPLGSQDPFNRRDSGSEGL